MQAVVSIFPPTDLEPYRTNPKMVKQFPALEYDPNRTRDVSPLFHVSKDDAPTLLIHGDKDELVPLFHSEKIKKAFDDARFPVNLRWSKVRVTAFPARMRSGCANDCSIGSNNTCLRRSSRPPGTRVQQHQTCRSRISTGQNGLNSASRELEPIFNRCANNQRYFWSDE